MSVECNIKFDNDFILLPETAPVEGEWVDIEWSTLSPTTVTSSSSDMTPHATPPTAPPAADPLEGLDKLPEEKRSVHTKKPSAYVQRINAGKGMATGLPSKPTLPRSVDGAALAEDCEYALSSATEEALGGEP